MIPYTYAFVSEYLGQKVRVTSSKSVVEAELEGVSRLDLDSLLIFTVNGEIVNIPLLDVYDFQVVGEDPKVVEPEMSDVDFAAELDMLVDGVLSSVRYEQLTDESYDIPRGIDDVTESRNLTASQSIKLAKAIIAKQEVTPTSAAVEEAETSPDAAEAISDAAVNEVVAELGLEAEPETDAVSDEDESVDEVPDKPLSKSQAKRLAVQQAKEE